GSFVSIHRVEWWIVKKQSAFCKLGLHEDLVVYHGPVLDPSSRNRYSVRPSLTHCIDPWAIMNQRTMMNQIDTSLKQNAGAPLTGFWYPALLSSDVRPGAMK